MSATLGINKLKIEPVGSTVTVPNNNTAKLMYYLSCVLKVIQYNQDSKLIDFEHYYNLNNEEKKLVYQLALLFKPEIFLEAKVFIKDADLLPSNVGNEFYKITDETIGLHVNQQIMIGGKSVKILKIMACDDSWLNRNYYNPITGIMNELRRRTVSVVQNQNIYTTTSSSSRPVIINRYIPRNVEFGSCSVDMNCPFCYNFISTETECSCNCGACCLCLVVGLFFFVCIQLCKGKSIFCNNVIHKCPICRQIVGTYSSC